MPVIASPIILFYYFQNYIMPYTSNSYSKTYTIIGLSQDDLNAEKVPQFALISDRQTWLWNSIAWKLVDFELAVFQSKEYWDKLQAIFTIEEEWEEVKIKCNMSWAVRTIMNKLASQDGIGNISIQLLNTKSDDWKRRPWTVVTNNLQKIDKKYLENNDKSILLFDNPKTWMQEKIWNSTKDFANKWYKSKYFDVLLANKIKSSIKSDNDTDWDLPF